MRIPFSSSTARLLAILLTLLCWSCKQNFTSENELHIGNGVEPESLDPHICSAVPCGQILNALFVGLTQWSNKGPKAGVAKSWDISDDYKTYTFHLKKSTWVDGNPLTSKDFLYSWRRLADPKTGASYASLMDGILNYRKVSKGELPVDSLGLWAPNDSTFIVELETPVPYFLDLLSFTSFFPVPAHKIKKHSDQWTKVENFTSNGYFTLENWETHKIISLQASKEGFTPKLNALHFYPVDDVNTELLLFAAGQLQWIRQIPPAKLNLWMQRDEFSIKPRYGTYFYRLNHSLPEFQSPEIGLALNYAIDREKIVRYVTRAGEQAAEGLVPDGTPGYEPQRTLTFSPELADSLWKAAPIKPKELVVTYNQSESHKKIAEAIGQMWEKQFGVPVKTINVEWKTLLSKMKQLDYQIIRGSWIGDYVDPSTFLNLFRSYDGNKRAGYARADYDSLASLSLKAEGEERMILLQEMEKILSQDPPHIPIYFYQNKELRHPDLRGIEENPLGSYTFHNLYWDGPND